MFLDYVSIYDYLHYIIEYPSPFPWARSAIVGFTQMSSRIASIKVRRSGNDGVGHTFPPRPPFLLVLPSSSSLHTPRLSFLLVPLFPGPARSKSFRIR